MSDVLLWLVVEKSLALPAFANVVPQCCGAGANRDKRFSIKPVDFLYFLAVSDKKIT